MLLLERGLGPVDILVNNAGVAEVGRAEKHRLSQWDHVLAVNLRAVFQLTQRVGRAMIERAGEDGVGCSPDTPVTRGTRRGRLR